LITSPDTINTFVNTPTSYQASAIDLDGNPVSFEFINFPDWLTLNGHILSGVTPNQSLDLSFTLIASDGDLADTLNVIILVHSKTLSIIKENIIDALYKNEYHNTLKATGGITPYFWSIVKGNLAKGLYLSSSGKISGFPDSSGFYKFTAKVQDSNNPPQIDTLSFSFNVNNNFPHITSSDTISTKKGDEFFYQATANDPDSNELFYKFSNYPVWLTVTDSVLSGSVPASATDTSFSLIVSDGELFDSIKVNININEPSSIITQYTPSQFLLSDNYPNPFNPITNIKIELPENTKFVLSIYDITGKLVHELYNGQLNAGIHILTWDANNIPTGIYFIHYKSDKLNKIIKCTLLK